MKDTFLEVRIFGLSVVGGDLSVDESYREAFLEKGLDGHGWVASYDTTNHLWHKDSDVTLPVAWVVGI